MSISYKITKRAFSKEVEDTAKFRALSYLDAVLFVAEKYNTEPEDCAKLISKPIKEKLEIEGQKKNILKKPTELPV